MKKRITCFLLAMMMVLPMIAMTACSSSSDKDASDVSSEETRTYVTLDLWLPYYEGTTEESIELVQDALNAISEEKYSTHLELHFVANDKYEAAVQDRIGEIKAAQIRLAEESKALKAEQQSVAAEGKTQTTAVTAAPEATETDEYGIPTIVYPQVGETQMDIFLIRGYSDYTAYVADNALTALDSDMTEGDAKLLKTHIYPYYLTYAKVGGSTYAIPNNRAIGEYTFLLVNKACVDAVNEVGANIDPSRITSPYTAQNLIAAVAEYCPDVVPVAAPFDYYSVQFWNASNDDTFSLVASQIGRDFEEALKLKPLSPQNILRCTNFTNTYYMNKLIAENGWVGDGTAASGSFAVATMKGGMDVYEEYSDEYYVTVLEPPTATAEEICADMFGVSAYTKNSARALEIITLINTDADFRTILQYGVEGIHWKYADDTKKTIVQLSDAYRMHLEETGNSYITYPDYGESKDFWEYAKTQNLEVRISPYMGFTTTISDIIASVNAKLATTEKSIASKQADIDYCEQQIKDFDDTIGTEDELTALQEDLASAKNTMESLQITLRDVQMAVKAVSALTADSQTVLASIEAMTAQEFFDQLKDLQTTVGAYDSLAFLLAPSGTYDTYKLTEDEKVTTGKTYYTYNGGQYSTVTGVRRGDPIPENSYYEKTSYAATDALVYQYVNFWTENSAE